MGVSFDSYKTFYYVAKFRSFTEAARALYVTQPTVTHAIQMLEKELDCILFQRSRKGVSLTPEAAMLYEHVKAACEHIFEAENALKAKKELLEGQIRIGAGETTLHFFLLPYLKQFKTLYPGVKIKVNNTSTPASLSALRAGHIDFAILVMRPDYKGAFLPRDRFSVTRLAGFQDIFITADSQNRVDLRKLFFDFLCIALRKAARGDHSPAASVFFTGSRSENRFDRLCFCAFNKAARINDDYIRLFLLIRNPIAGTA